MAIVMVGNGSHAKDMIADFSSKWIHMDWRGRNNFRQFDHHERVGDFRADEIEVYIAINNPWKRAEVAGILGVQDHNWVHHHAYWGPHTTINYGTHVNYGASLVRCVIGHHCTISPGVTICGDVTIGDRVLVGAGATICDRVTIGNDVTIGAGAVVLPETVVPDGETWIGVPARVR